MPETLKPFQTEIEPSTLYAVAAAPTTAPAFRNASASQLLPTIEVAGHQADVYVSQVLPDSAPTGMTKTADNLQGILAFDFIPNYLYVDPVTTDPTAIVLSGVSAEEV